MLRCTLFYLNIKIDLGKLGFSSDVVYLWVCIKNWYQRNYSYFTGKSVTIFVNMIGIIDMNIDGPEKHEF